MMFLLFFISSMCAELPSVVNGTLTITVASEGELSTNYSVDDIKTSGATCLKVVGPVNSDDFTTMKNVQKTENSGSITQVDLSEAVFSELPLYAFETCRYLTSISLPQSLTTIGEYAFSGCYALQAMDLSNTQLTTIKNNAFYDCVAMSSISFPSTLATLEYYAFYNCTALTELDLSGTAVTDIPSGVCQGYRYDEMQLTTLLLPSTITSIGSSAFYNCNKLASFSCDVTGSLTIGASAFFQCNAMTSVSITTQGELSIDYSAFSCTALTDITLNAQGDVTLGGAYGSPFSCQSLRSFTLHTPGKLTAVNSLLGLSWDNQTLTTVVLDAKGEGSTIGRYLASYATKLESITLPSGLVSLGEEAFAYCHSLRSVQLPSTLTSWDSGYRMFYECRSLTSLDLSALTSITQIGSSAFNGCENLATLALPSGITSIGNSAFEGCKALTSLPLSSTVTSLGSRAFYGCSSLQNITVPASVTSFGDYIFYECKGMTSATILADIETLPEYTFTRSTSLQTVELGNAIKTIEREAFLGCSSLTDVTLPNTLTTIGVGAFTDCTSLRDVKLPSGLTTISQNAFSHCSNLSMISLPATLTTIGQGAFIQCESLVMLDVPEGITTLPREMLAYCYGLQSLYLPSTLTHMEIFALQSTDALIDVHVKATTPPTQGGGNRGGAGVTLFVPAASISAYQTADYWNEFSPIYAELTNLSTLVDDEFSMLQTLFSKTGGAQWTRPWTFGATKAETAMLEGVKISNGHIKQLVLTNNNLTGQLPQELLQFPQAWYINVSNNSFSGDVDDFFEDAAVNNVITYLDLSHNNLTGNIGTLTRTGAINTDLLPNLKTLKVSHNHIRDVKPVLPDHITTLDISGQTINDTISYRDFMETSGGNMQYFFPTLMLYSHGFAYSYDHFIVSSPNGSTPWELVFKKASHQFYGNYNTGIDAWNYDPSGRVVHLYNNRCRLNTTFDFDMGDVNYDAEFDVADLQTLINFAVNPSAYSKLSPFNWYAANTKLADQGDAEVINVQDVVCEVNLLLDEDIEPSLARAYGAYKAHEADVAYEPQATLTIEDGVLVLTSEVPVAALDINISGDNVRWSQELSLFSRKSRGCRTIFYSMMGDVLPAGRTVLGTVSGSATVNFVKLADPDGKLIPTAFGNDTNGIEEIANSQQPLANSPIYDLQGRKVNSQLKTGVYVVNGKKVVK